MFPSVWFNASTTEPGRDALGWYHEKKSDDEREVGLGPEHDWSSHGADAFGLMAVVHSEHEDRTELKPRQRMGAGRGGWMGG
jgi:phage terminase large subunit